MAKVDTDSVMDLNGLLDYSNTLPEGDIKGFVLRLPVEANFAYYLVSKDKPLTLKYIPFGNKKRLTRSELTHIYTKDVLQYQRSYIRLFGVKE